MPRKKQNKQVSFDDILEQFDHKYSASIEEAMRKDQILIDAGLAAPTSPEDYSYCPSCRGVCYRGSCSRCEYIASTESDDTESDTAPTEHMQSLLDNLLPDE